MHNSLAHRERQTWLSEAATHRRPHLEPLERRSLMSWTGVETSVDDVTDMAADNAGNVYIAAYADGFENMVVQKGNPGAVAGCSTIYQNASGEVKDVATDIAGDVFIAGYGVGSDGKAGHWLVSEQTAGGSGFSAIDDIPTGICQGVASDADGNVYAVGAFTATTIGKGGKTVQTRVQVIRKRAAGAAAFTTVYSSTTGPAFLSIAVAGSGISASVYVTASDSSSTNGYVYKGIGGGQSWSVVDQSPGTPRAVIADASGNVFVAGSRSTQILTAYSAKTGKPVYANVSHWIVRKSGNAGATWIDNDNFALGANAAYAYALGFDAVGNVYAAGQATDSADVPHAIVRSNAGGSWNTVDDYQHASYEAFTADSNGNLYAGGADDYTGLIRTAPPVVAPTTTFSALSISSSDDLLHDLSGSGTVLLA
jgi:hypothetical protein